MIALDTVLEQQHYHDVMFTTGDFPARLKLRLRIRPCTNTE